MGSVFTGNFDDDILLGLQRGLQRGLDLEIFGDCGVLGVSDLIRSLKLSCSPSFAAFWSRFFNEKIKESLRSIDKATGLAPL